MYSFDAEKIKDEIVTWIRGWFEKNGKGCNAVIGISGGKDSSVVAALCVEALGKEKVYGVLMPNGIQSDINIARDLISYLGICSVEIDISVSVQGVIDGITNGIYDNSHQGCDFLKISDQTKVNLPPRIRMATLYAVSQSLNGRVANTCNLSEGWLGYSTRYGDSVGDFSPLANLTVTEVKAIGYECGLPEKFIEKIPSDGLCGKTDEENFGFSYAVLDKYIRTGEIENPEVKKKIDLLHEKNLFKMSPMPCY